MGTGLNAKPVLAASASLRVLEGTGGLITECADAGPA